MQLDVKDFIKYYTGKKKRTKNAYKYTFVAKCLSEGRKVEIIENGVVKYLTILDGRLITLTPKLIK